MADARPTFSCRSDIRSAKQKQLSRPMTGHTPQKLPSFDAISCIIAVHAQNVPTRARLSYHHLRYLSRIFSEKITKFFIIFSLIFPCARKTKTKQSHTALLPYLTLVAGFTGDIHAQALEGLFIHGREDHRGVGLAATPMRSSSHFLSALPPIPERSRRWNSLRSFVAARPTPL